MKILDVPRSGSYQGITSSRNRFGQYVRTRAIPVNPNTNNQGTVRTRLSELMAGWAGLTANQRAGWAALGLNLQRTDSLGQTYNLTGAQAYASINMTRLGAGDAIVDDAPIVTTPAALLTSTITSAGGTLSLAYTATPLVAGSRLFVYASPQRSVGRGFENDLRLIFVSAAAAASPANILASYSARFGAPVVGNKIFFSLQVYELGFLSGPMATSHVVVA